VKQLVKVNIMSVNKIFRAATIIAIVFIGSFSLPQEAQCGVVRDDGSICQRLAGGEKDCKELGGTWDSKKNCCEIQNI